MALNWLRHIRKREFYFIFGGLFGLLLVVTFLIKKSTYDREQKEIAEQQQQTRVEQQRLETERARALREETARQLAAEAERRRQAEQKRLIQEQLSELRQRGVRGIPIQSPPHDTFQNLGVWLAVRSQPEGADVYFNWQNKGKTPLWLRGAEVTGLLLIVKEDHEAWYRDITQVVNGTVAADLSVDTPHPRERLVLILSEDASDNRFAFLRNRLLDAGFILPEERSVADFQRKEQTAGGLANDGFRAWARTKFTADLLLRANIRERKRDIGAQSQVLAGTVRVFVDVDFDVYALTTGDHLAQITAADSAFGLDHDQGFQKALHGATTHAVQKLKTQLER